MKRKTLAAMMLAVVLPVLAVAQREYPCYQLANEPVLDGKLEDAVWQNIPEATGFFVLGGMKFAVQRPTFFKMGWTANALWLAIRCREPAPDKIKANAADKPLNWKGDYTGVFFIPPGAADFRELIVSAKGARWNGVGGQGDALWDWKMAATIGENEWRAEIEVPFAALRKTPGLNERWKFNIGRTLAEGAESERFTCWPRLLKSFHEKAAFAEIVFKGAVPAEAEARELEKQMNNTGIALQKVLQGELKNMAPRYKEFSQLFQEFDGKGMATQKLKDEAVALRQEMDSMEKAATAGNPDVKAIEAALSVNTAEKVEKAMASCGASVFRRTMVDNPFPAGGYSLEWTFDGRSPAPVTNSVNITFNCSEKTIFDKAVTKVDYNWRCPKFKAGSPAGEKEVEPNAFYIWYDTPGFPPSPEEQPRLGLWVYGNGSGDKLMRVLPIDWKGWRFVELSHIAYKSAFVIVVAHADQTAEREPLYFGPVFSYGKEGKIPSSAPSSPYPFPIFLAAYESLRFPINNGAYDVEVEVDRRVTDGKTPDVRVNDAPADNGSSPDILNYHCEVKDGYVDIHGACEGHQHIGLKHIRFLRQNQTVAYCDASFLQPRGGAEKTAKESSVSCLETNAALFEEELGGKQLAAAPTIIYQFKIDPGDYNVRLRFNRWRGIYPETASFDVFLQGEKRMEMEKPNKKLLVKDFAVKAPDGRLQIALLGGCRDAYAWLGDISVFKDERMIGFLQPRPPIPESMSGDYHGLRNLVPNPSFEVEKWERNWASVSPESKPVRTNATAHHGNWSMCLEHATGSAGIIFNNRCTPFIVEKIKSGTLSSISIDEKLGESDMGVSGLGAPVDYTRTYRFSGWVKTENATDQTYLQIVWVAPRAALSEPILPEFPGMRKITDYISIFGVSESVKITGATDWQKLVVEAKPPYGTTHASFILRSDGNEGKVYFDDLDFDGFGTEPVEIVLPQIGYHPKGEKQALVKTRAPVADGRFELNDQAGKPVFSEALRPLGVDAWGLFLSQIDFSNFKIEGQYSLKVKIKNRPETKTPFFKISSSLYRDLGLMSINGFFHIYRSGHEVPGWHAACHLDAAAIRNGVRWFSGEKEPLRSYPDRPAGEIIKHVDLTGGWYDASLDKYGHVMAPGVINLCRFWEDTHFVSDQLREQYPDVLSEACWGADYIMRSISKEDGKIYDSVIDWNPVKKEPIGLHDRPCIGYTDNIVGTTDDPIIGKEIDLAVDAHDPQAIRPVALTRLAGHLREYDKAKAASLLETAGMWSAGNNMQLALARYVINGKRKEDLPKLEEMAGREMVDCPSRRFPDIYAGMRNDKGGVFAVLFDYFEINPDSKLKDAFKVSVRRICDEIVKPLADNNSYGVVDQLTQPVMTRAYSQLDGESPFRIDLTKYLQMACFLIRSGQLLKDMELVWLGERHIQYALGLNPTGLSMVGGTGYKVYCILTNIYPYGSKWIELKGQIPGGVMNWVSVSDGARRWICGYAPLDFPVMITTSELVNSMEAAGGYFETPTGWFIAACGALDRALKESK